MTLPLETYVGVVGDEAGRIARAARRDPGAPIRACPGWSMADLVRHLGQVHRHKAMLLRARAAEDHREWRDAEPSGDLVEWFEEGAADLVGALAEVDPDAEVWNWSRAPNVARFWHRRMAHETAMHRWDAEDALGDAGEVEPGLAADGVAEFLEVWAPGATIRGAGETIHLHRTDGEGEWLLTVGPIGVDVTGGHAKGDAALRGTASDLLLVLWGRRGLDAIECFGDRGLVERFLRSVDTD